MTLWWHIFQKLLNTGTWNFVITLLQVLKLCYQNLGSIYLIVSKLCAFRQRSNFGNFQQFFLHSFQLKWKFWIQIYQNILFPKLKKYFFIYKNQFLGEKWKIVGFFCRYFRNTSWVQWFCKCWWLQQKNLSDYDQFLFKQWLEVNKKPIFLGKKLKFG